MKQRILPLSSPYSEYVEADFKTIMPDGMPPLAIFRTVANNPRVLHRMVIGGLLDKGSISLADRELIILRVCGICGAEYEWGVHVAGFAEKAGFSMNQISDTFSTSFDSTLWSSKQRLLLAMVDQLHFSSHIDDDLWCKLEKEYQPDQLIELIMVAGLYHAVSFIANACRVEKEAFAPSFSQFTENLNK